MASLTGDLDAILDDALNELTEAHTIQDATELKEICCICRAKPSLNNHVFMPCCRKSICKIPCFQQLIVSVRRVPNCPMCRHPLPTTDREEFELLKVGAQKGYAESQCGLGTHYYEPSVKQEHKKAVKWFTKAAEQGHTRSQFNLGLCYCNG